MVKKNRINLCLKWRHSQSWRNEKRQFYKNWPLIDDTHLFVTKNSRMTQGFHLRLYQVNSIVKLSLLENHINNSVSGGVPSISVSIFHIFRCVAWRDERMYNSCLYMYIGCFFFIYIFWCDDAILVVTASK